MSCVFEGIPAPAVTWRYLPFGQTESIVLSNGGNYRITSSMERREGAVYYTTISMLEFTSTSVADAGMYTCLADNGVINLIGAVTNGTGVLHFLENGESTCTHPHSSFIQSVNTDPTFIETPANQVVLAGASTTLNCAAASQGNLTTHWTKDGQPVESVAGPVVEDGVYRHNLLLDNLMASDSGFYNCTVVSTFQGVTLTSAAKLDVFSE